LFAGVQMVVPGDVAPAHRHSQSALRFVLEGKGAHTTVDGERTAMEPGDFVITPSMTWHDHSNETSEPMFWLDGLDIPMVQFSDPATGDFAMPTIGTFIQLLPKGFKTARYRATDATVFAAIEGKGRTRIGDQIFEWGARDLFVVPSWHWVSHEADTDSVLFS